MWELFDQAKHGRGTLGIIASLNGTTANPKLSIGRVLKDAGFDINVRYETYFNTTATAIGLKPAEQGLAIAHSSDNTHLSFTAFCRHYKLNKRYAVKSFERDGDMWVLPLTEVEKKSD